MCAVELWGDVAYPCGRGVRGPKVRGVHERGEHGWWGASLVVAHRRWWRQEESLSLQGQW